jgi:GTPase SAR1 family protein
MSRLTDQLSTIRTPQDFSGSAGMPSPQCEHFQLADWLSNLQTLATPNSYILLVGNKCDLEKDRQAGSDLVRRFSERHHLEATETSAQSGTNIKKAFARMAVEVSTRVANGTIALPSPTEGSSRPHNSQPERQRRTRVAVTDL